MDQVQEKANASMVTESGSAWVWGCVWTRGGCQGPRGYFWGDCGNVLHPDGGGGFTGHELARTHQTVGSVCMHFVVCKSYLDKSENKITGADEANMESGTSGSDMKGSSAALRGMSCADSISQGDSPFTAFSGWD